MTRLPSVIAESTFRRASHERPGALSRRSVGSISSTSARFQNLVSFKPSPVCCCPCAMPLEMLGALLDGEEGRLSTSLFLLPNNPPVIPVGEPLGEL